MIPLCSIPLLVAVGLSLSVPRAGQNPSQKVEAGEIVRKIDELYRSDSSYAEVEMEIVTPHWSRTLAIRFWTEGMKKTFIRVDRPPKEKGLATLRIGTEMWNYLPKVNKVMKIPPSMMMSSWMGSDFTNDDLVKEFTFFDDYRFDLVEPDNAEPGLIYVNCIPREGLPIVWGNVVVAVREERYVPVSIQYFDEKGNLMRSLYYKEIRELGGRHIPSTMEMIPQTKEGHKTVVRYVNLDFDPQLKSDVFSLRNLRSRP